LYLTGGGEGRSTVEVANIFDYKKFLKHRTVEISIHTCSPSFGITYHGRLSLRLVKAQMHGLRKSKSRKDDA